MKALQSQLDTIKFDYHKVTSKGEAETITTGSFARVEQEGCIFHKYEGKLISEKNESDIVEIGPIITCNGKTTSKLERKIQSSEEFMRGEILPGRDKRLLKVANYGPLREITTFALNFHKRINEDRDSFQISREASKINGYDTIKITGVTFGGTGTLTIWLSPELDLMPVRVEILNHNHNHNHNQTSTRNFQGFKQLQNGFFFPSKILYGEPDEAWTVIDFENVETGDFDKEIFTLKFPANTHVTDHVLKMSYSTNDASELGLLDVKDGEISTDIEPQNIVQNPELAEKALEEYVEKIQGRNESSDVGIRNNKDSENNISKSEKGYSGYILLIGMVALCVIFLAVFLYGKKLYIDTRKKFKGSDTF